MATATLAPPRAIAASPPVVFRHDPLRDFAHWAALTHHTGPVEVVFRKGLDLAGAAYCEAEPAPRIELNLRLSYPNLVNVLIHEMAHVLVWRRGGRWTRHDREFQRAETALGTGWTDSVMFVEGLLELVEPKPPRRGE